MSILTKPLIFFLFISFTLQVMEAQQQPNIIFIMSDDHTSQAVGTYGGRLASLDPTPNIDKLADEGMVFENAFCTNSICTPSRASIITGQYSQKNGVLDLDGSLSPSRHYLAMEMKNLGYSTAMIGKWHLKNEPNFDYYKVLPGQGKYFNPTFREKGIGNWPNNTISHSGHSSDVITNLSLDYLDSRDKTKPFFLMHHYKAPHDFFEYATRYASYLSNVNIPEPESMYSQPEFGSEATRGRNDSLIHRIGTSISKRHLVRNYVDHYFPNTSLNGDAVTSAAYQTYLKDYLRCVKGIDDNLGRLFDYLKTEGLWDNTVIVYTGDQGMMLGEHDFQDKRWMYDESMRMPFIVHYPELITQGSRSKLLINNTDYAPTLIELAGGIKPSYMQGNSFIKTLQGEDQGTWRKGTYYRYWMHLVHHDVPAHFGIRTDKYKLIFYHGRHYNTSKYGTKTLPWQNPSNIVVRTPIAWELYDLSIDPQELVNQYDNPDYQDVILELKKELIKQREDLDETDASYPEIQEVVNEHLIQPLGIDDFSDIEADEESIGLIYPNPVTTTFQIKLNRDMVFSDDITVKVFNTIGQELGVFSIANRKSSDLLEFNMGTYQNGIYFVEINNGITHQIEQILKQ